MAGASSGRCWRSVVGTNPPFAVPGRTATARHRGARAWWWEGVWERSGGTPAGSPCPARSRAAPVSLLAVSARLQELVCLQLEQRRGCAAARGRWPLVRGGPSPSKAPPSFPSVPPRLPSRTPGLPGNGFAMRRKQHPGSRATLPQGGSFQHPLCAPLGAEGAGETEAAGQEAAGAQNGEKTGFLALPLALPAGKGCSLPLRAGTAPARAPLFPLGFSAFPRSEDTPGPAATSPRGSFRFSPPPGCRLLGERGDCSPPGGVRQAPALCVAGLRGWLWPPARPRALCQRQLLAGTAWLPAPRQPCSLGRMAGCVRQHPGLLPRLSRVRSAPTLKAESLGGSSEGLRRGQKSPWGGTRWLHPCASHASALKAPGFPPCFPLPVNIWRHGGLTVRPAACIGWRGAPFPAAHVSFPSRLACQLMARLLPTAF